MAKKNLFETGESPLEGSEEVVESNSEGEGLTPDKLLELPDEELKNYGIDDPKAWKSYQKLLHKKEAEWAEKEKGYNEKLGKVDSQFEMLQKEILSLKNPEPKQPEIVPPKLSPRPSNFDMTEALTDPNSNSAKWYNEYQQYVIDKANYQDYVINNLQQTIMQERKMKEANQAKELFKSQTIASFQENGLDPQDAVQAYNALEQIYASDIKNGTKLFAQYFKGSQNPKVTEKVNEFKKQAEKKNDFLPPGLSSSGEIPTDGFEKSFMDEIQGGNKTKQIIGNRTKRK